MFKAYRAAIAPLWLAANLPLPAAAATVDFHRDVRPILSDNCFACHGNDESKNRSGLRLDTPEGPSADLGGRFGVVPGEVERSEVYKRISSDDVRRRMPPSSSGASKLEPEEIETIRLWIDQGAEGGGHWAFETPMRPELPEVDGEDWARNPIDFFILDRLSVESLEPSPTAPRETLIRRVSLDLTGLPPTPAEVDAFLAADSADAYEKLVDRLLESPRYGERMATPWLDAARYADTNGYETDAERYQWRWRDWVIEAFNSNMPFDQFTIEQIAGDMLPNATLEQKIASGFNRNHRQTGEGGTIPEEYAVEYVADRVDTTSTVWLGLSMSCARCHDHKYDPITQKDFYRLFAYFNNVPERGMAFKYGNSPPMIVAPTRAQQAMLGAHDRELAAARKRFESLADKAEAEQRKWERKLAQGGPVDWTMPDRRLAHFTLDTEDGEASTVDGRVPIEEGVIGRAASFDGKGFLEAGEVVHVDFEDEFTLSAWVKPERLDGAILSKARDVERGTGYGIYLENGKVQVNLVWAWVDRCIRIETEEAIPQGDWAHVLVTYDGSRLAKGLKIYLDGREAEHNVLHDLMTQHFAIKEPFRIGAGNGQRFYGLIDDVRAYSYPLSPDEVAILASSAPLNAIAARPAARRGRGERDKLRLAFLHQHAPKRVREAWADIFELSKQREAMVDAFPTVMVMAERPQRKQTHVLVRGAYDAPGEAVEPGVPAALPPLPTGASNDRLGLARWLVDRSNPLTSRVTVNRFWQMFFGIGLVKTAEDFGSQGEPPANRELLDWLAVEFVDQGWDTKGIVKTIVTSATYRQSSKARPELRVKDPENRLLARGPRFRLPAEAVRDQALALAGLLVEKQGGPSVKPYQPAGLWTELGGTKGYEADSGENLYRRSLYTFWKRTVPPPSMLSFDSAGREACTVRAVRTNTPLQALNLMNDVAYLEMSRRLAERMIREGGENAQDRLGWGFRAATARRPGEDESGVLASSLAHFRDHFASDPDAAERYLRQGESPRDQSIPPTELAAYTSVASLILNLDETITKE